jgi:hypothetical protein
VPRLKKFGVWSRDKRALSPIFATVLLATIIIVFGSVAYYYSSNITRTATSDYVSSLSGSQQAIAERIGFENVVYNQTSKTLTVYIINCGIANNLQINSIFIYDSNHNIVGQPYSGSFILQPIVNGGPSPTPITSNSLNIGKEASFSLTQVTKSNNQPLGSGSIYIIHLITKNGSTFDYEFSP